MRELLGWLVAACFALAALALLSLSPRGDVLLRDGDAVLPLLFSHSLDAGQDQDWAFSSVLFAPELAVFRLLTLVLPDRLAQVLGAAVLMLALYGAMRWAAGARARGSRSPVFGSLLAFGVFCALAASGLSTSRDAMDLASLMGSLTYYSATVVATVLVAGTLRRLADGGPRTALLTLLGAVTAVSVWTNPIFIAWAVLPLGVIALLVRRRQAAAAAWVLALSSIIGMLARIPIGDSIVKSGFGYMHPTEWTASAQYYVGLLWQRLTEPLGVAALTVLVAVLVTSIVLLRRGGAGGHRTGSKGARSRTVRRHSHGQRLLLWIALLGPVAVALGMTAVGTQAARYLQPVVFLAVLGLTAVRAPKLPRRRAVGAVSAGTVVALAAGIVAVPVAAHATSRTDADLACVVHFVEERPNQTGAGQFWSVRLPKASISDPARLVQVDHELNAYGWIVNRADFAEAQIDYLLLDPALDPMFDLDLHQPGIGFYSCGRYDIIQFPQALQLGPIRS